jgi:hypothetical protein
VSQALSEFFRALLSEDPAARQVRMPDTTPVLSGETEDDFLNDPRPFVEGGDTFVLGKDTVAPAPVLAQLSKKTPCAGTAGINAHLRWCGFRRRARNVWSKAASALLDAKTALLRNPRGGSSLLQAIASVPLAAATWEAAPLSKLFGHRQPARDDGSSRDTRHICVDIPSCARFAKRSDRRAQQELPLWVFLLKKSLAAMTRC